MSIKTTTLSQEAASFLVTIHPQYANFKEALLLLFNNFDSQGTYVTKGDRNVIKKITINDTTFNIKKFKTPNIFQSLVYRFIRKSKAKRSYEYAMRLTKMGIDTPFPVAFAEQFKAGLKKSYYVSLHVDYDLDFRVLNHNPLLPDRDLILQQFAAFTFKMHENGIRFLDHSPGNTLIQKVAQGLYKFYLIDLNRMKFESMDFRARMKNFRRLWLSKKMIQVISPVYAELYGKSENEVSDLMYAYSKAFQNKANLRKLKKRARKNRKNR